MPVPISYLSFNPAMSSPLSPDIIVALATNIPSLLVAMLSLWLAYRSYMHTHRHERYYEGEDLVVGVPERQQQQQPQQQTKTVVVVVQSEPCEIIACEKQNERHTC